MVTMAEKGQEEIADGGRDDGDLYPFNESTDL